MKKKLFCIQPLWCTAKLDRFYAINLVLTKGNGSEMTFVAWATKIKLWKPSYDWMTWCGQQSEDINYIVMEDLKKHPFKGVLRKRCSENMLQISRRTPMPKCEIFRAPFYKNTSEGGLLNLIFWQILAEVLLELIS